MGLLNKLMPIRCIYRTVLTVPHAELTGSQAWASPPSRVCVRPPPCPLIPRVFACWEASFCSTQTSSVLRLHSSELPLFVCLGISARVYSSFSFRFRLYGYFFSNFFKYFHEGYVDTTELNGLQQQWSLLLPWRVFLCVVCVLKSNSVLSQIQTAGRTFDGNLPGVWGGLGWGGFGSAHTLIRSFRSVALEIQCQLMFRWNQGSGSCTHTENEHSSVALLLAAVHMG